MSAKDEIVGCLKDIRNELTFQRETLNQLKAQIALEIETWERYRIEPLENRVYQLERSNHGK